MCDWDKREIKEYPVEMKARILMPHSDSVVTEISLEQSIKAESPEVAFGKVRRIIKKIALKRGFPCKEGGFRLHSEASTFAPVP